MGGGASTTYRHDSLADRDPADARASPLAWATYMRPDGAPDANAADRACSGNTGPSNCGECAAFAAVEGLGVHPTAHIGDGSVRVNARDHGDDLGRYLAARAVAGATAADVIDGARALSRGAVDGAFFALGPAGESARACPEHLVDALGLWLAAGCTGVATLNLQAIYPGADAWHHQVGERTFSPARALVGPHS